MSECDLNYRLAGAAAVLFATVLVGTTYWPHAPWQLIIALLIGAVLVGAAFGAIIGGNK